MKSDSASAPSARWPRRIMVGFALALVIAALAGFIYENVSEARDRRFNPMPGRLVEVDGRKMHIDCAGQGGPAVILDAGLGDTYLSWRKVQPEIAKFVEVCSYDRAGLGYSDSSSQPRTSEVIAAELHQLLSADGIAPPFILVGHSMGGYDVRVYAHLYPHEVAGMVLVDASHPQQESRLPRELKDMEGSWQREAQFLEYTMPFGWPRLLGLCEDDPVLRAAECNWHSARTSAEEMKSFSESAQQAAATTSLRSMPLVVLSRDPKKLSSDLPPDLAKRINDEWEEMQEELAGLSTTGIQTFASHSGHYIQIDRPDLVINAVHSVVVQIRRLQPDIVSSGAKQR